MESNKNINFWWERKLDLSESYYQYNFGKKAKDSFNLEYYPSESWYLNISGELGDEVAYSIDAPKIADLRSYNHGIYYKPNDNLILGLSSRYFELKDPDNSTEFFSGSINRVSSTYSFNNDLNVKVLIEKNEFNDNYFLETLVKWAPNPYIIFYAGGSQFFEESAFSKDHDLRLETSNVYLKFQYFYSL